jgi:hypothetical protein
MRRHPVTVLKDLDPDYNVELAFWWQRAQVSMD